MLRPWNELIPRAREHSAYLGAPAAPRPPELQGENMCGSGEVLVEEDIHGATGSSKASCNRDSSPPKATAA